MIVNNANDEIFIHSEKELVLLNNQANLKIIALNPTNSIANVRDNTINYQGIYAGISDEFTVLKGEIKNNVVLSAPPALLNNVASGYFGFLETVELPKGWKITTSGKTVNSLTSSPLSIVNSKGNPVLTIPEPVFFDNYGSEEDGANPVEGKYLVKQKNKCWTITTLVPVAWLKDVNTQYPVSIDPTVIIPGTTGGWQSPNNYIDSPGYVFVGVCCGNLTHRAWIKFDVSSIPSNSCITKVEFQPYVVTENSTSPEVVLINDVTGAFGPYGAITPAAYTDFGNGNYTSFTLTVLGLYGYYTLGASANTLLQSQLPGGWFQLAFQFSNEPSTDWKNMNGTSSNLRVTYTAPPCALPIELLSFTAKCAGNDALLQWQTATETNNRIFTLYRSHDGINFNEIGTVKGAVNSSSTHNYSFTDYNPFSGASYYKISQTDLDGTTTTVKTISFVSCAQSQNVNAFLAGNNIIEVQINAAQNDTYTFALINILGQTVFTQTENIYKGMNDIKLSPHTANGMYILRISGTNNVSYKKLLFGNN